MDNKWGRTSTTWYIFLLINVTLQILSVVGDGGAHIAHNMQEKPPLPKMVLDTLATFKKTHKSSWDKIKAVINYYQLQFFPPNLDFRGQDEQVDTSGRMKEAAEKSFEVSQVTAEESAKSAAKVVGEAVHKVKDKLSNDDKESRQQDEL